MKIAVSILSADDRIKCIDMVNNTTSDYFHIDMMDGKFVDNYQMSCDEVNEFSKFTNKPLDIHLMVEDPNSYINKLDNNNIRNITFHEEVNVDKNEIIKNIKNKGYKVGMSIKPDTDISNLIPYLKELDLILVMSVEPGKGGQKFMPSTFDRIKQLKILLNKYNLNNIEIEVDGGINNTNFGELKDIKVDIAVIGSYITNSDDYQNQINKLF